MYFGSKKKETNKKKQTKQNLLEIIQSMTVNISPDYSNSTKIYLT